MTSTAADPLRDFERRFGTWPTHRVRVPGRVNLIGEHIDYCGLSVLPMALTRAVALLLRPRADGIVRMHNTDPRFGGLEFELSDAIPPGPQGDWGNYPRAAAQALVRAHGVTSGFDASLTSDLPPAAGLSSSSALVCAVGLGLCAANEVPVAPLDLAAVLAAGERYVGTQGGGMDQAIVLGARAGTASRVDFEPLALTPVPLPPDWRFVVASSGIEAEKSGAARDAYNRRRHACEAALARVWADLGLDGEPSYRGLLDRVPLRRLLDAAVRLSSPLDRRFRHVVTEGRRVAAAEAALRSGDAPAFGRLMDASHASLRDEYEVSHPALDALVDASLQGGAEGARLTGAGFGGCIVALARTPNARKLLGTLEDTFYGPRGLTSSDAPRFVAEAGRGGTVAAPAPIP